MPESFHLDESAPPGDPERWVAREPETPPPDNTWLDVAVDMRPPSEVGEPWSQPPRRRIQVYVGGAEKLTEILRASDRIRARMMRRDIKWMVSVLEAAGLELVIARDPEERE